MKKTVPEFILDGSIVVDSVEAFGSIIKEFPDRPELLKMYAEMLAAKRLKDAAIEQYQQAARLFLDAGRLFQSWVSKTLQWGLQRPSRDQLLEFHHAVANTAQNSAPVDEFIKNLTPAERMAVFSQFRRIYAPAGKTILKAGDFPRHFEGRFSSLPKAPRVKPCRLTADLCCGLFCSPASRAAAPA